MSEVDDITVKEDLLPPLPEGVANVKPFIKYSTDYVGTTYDEDNLPACADNTRNDACCAPGACPRIVDEPEAESEPEPDEKDPFITFYEVGRKAIDYEFPIDDDAERLYFNPHTGAVQTENISEIGATLIGEDSGFNTDEAKKILEETRSVRIGKFHEVMDKLVNTDEDTMHNFDGDDSALALEDIDKVLITLNCDTITGIPTGTGMATIEGSVKVALVERTLPDAEGRQQKVASVHFSTGTGEATVSYAEAFNVDASSQNFALCSCCSIGPLYEKKGDVSSHASYNMHYSASTTRCEQYVVLPVADTIVDAHAMRAVAGHMTAAASSSASKEPVPEEPKPCCPPLCGACCSCQICSCQMCKDFFFNRNFRCRSWCWDELLRCYGVKYSDAIIFEGNDSYAIGKGGLSDAVKATKTVDEDVKWTVSKSKNDEIFVVMHYRHLLNNSISKLTMKATVNPGQDATAIYKQCQQFVSLVAKSRTLFGTDTRGFMYYQPKFVLGAPSSSYRELYHTPEERLVAKTKHDEREAAALGNPVLKVALKAARVLNDVAPDFVKEAVCWCLPNFE